MITRSPVLACLLVTMAAIGPAAAQGTPRSVSDCERLKNDLAYNQCLAMFGPAAKNVAGGEGGGSNASTSTSVVSADAAAAAGIPSADEPELQMPGRRGRHGRASRRGRQSMSFAVATSGQAADDGTGSRHSRYRHRRRH